MALPDTGEAHVRRPRRARPESHHRQLDEIVTDQWRDPDDYLEPLTGAPHSKLRIGQFRLGTECDYEEKVLDVYTVERRGGAYKPGDD